MFGLFGKDKKEDEYPKTKTEEKTASKTYEIYEVQVTTVSGDTLNFQHEGTCLIDRENEIKGNKVMPKESGLGPAYLDSISKTVSLETKSQAPTVNIDNVETYDSKIIGYKHVMVDYKVELEKKYPYGIWAVKNYEIESLKVEEVNDDSTE